MANPLIIEIITLHPEMFSSLEYGVIGRAITREQIKINCHNLRDHAHNKHRQVDDKPYGGQCGMVLKYEPLKQATEHIFKQYNTREIPVILPCPKGKQWQQSDIPKLKKHSHLIFVCGRYQGIDQRYIDKYVTNTWSIGNYVLTGGELPCMVMVDSVCRSLPNVLGNSESYKLGTHQEIENEAPLYTRPRRIDEMEVPKELTSGDPKQIEQWKKRIGRQQEDEELK